MSNGYRNIVAAFAGLAALCCAFGTGLYYGTLNYPEEQRYQSYRYAADKPVEIDPAAARWANPQAFQYRTPCNEPKGKDESDLCAQWKAARAGEASAFWTERGFWIGVVGSALLLWQIILTRRAVEDTGLATVQMQRANSLAEQNSRPHLYFVGGTIYFDNRGDDVFLTVLTGFENGGATPATITRSAIVLGCYITKDDNPYFGNEESFARSVGINVTHTIAIGVGYKDTLTRIKDAVVGVRYEHTVFGKPEISEIWLAGIPNRQKGELRQIPPPEPDHPITDFMKDTWGS